MNKPRSFVKQLIWMAASLLITVIVMACAAFLYLDSQLPDVQALRTVQLPIPLRVYTSDGQLLAEFGEISRTPVPIKQVPPLLVKAFLATEDQRFFEHGGVDVWGLMRASATLLISGSKLEGGSTITMQVARNFYLTRKKTFMRKLTEIMLAMKIEREFSKEQILELYLNKIYLGNRAYGVAAAAQIYFDKTLDQLTLPEMALIAGLPKAPSTINPLANPVACKDRRNHVLTRMFDLGIITRAQYEAAIAAPLTASYHGQVFPVKAPYVAEMARDMMVTSFNDDAYTKGYKVYTTINSQQQLAANDALRDNLLAYDHRHGYRGPEKNLGHPTSDHDEKWLVTLQKTVPINDLKPAAVLAVGDQNFTALMADGSVINVPWTGMSWARPLLSNDTLGRAPKTAHDIVKVGDLIRTRKVANGNWELDQIPDIEGAFVALNPHDGAITALVGGFDFRNSKFNRVTQAERQPGSSFKPFIYSAALAKGYTLANVVSDDKVCFNTAGSNGPWCPQNDKNEHYGNLRLRVALAHSVNIVTVKLLQAIGVPYAIKYAGRFGFDINKIPRNLTIALGSGEETPLEMVRAYAVFANGGYRITPYLIDHITDNTGQTVYQSNPKVACESCIVTQKSDDSSDDNTPTGDSSDPTSQAADIADNKQDKAPDKTNIAPQAIPPQIAFLMTSVLKDVITYGTAYAAKPLKRSDIAGKTGTTNDNVDTWFSGFNSDVVATAWVGFDKFESIEEYGSQVAVPMWAQFMGVALAGKPEHTMGIPAGITTMLIDPVTGMRATDGTPGAIEEYFRSDTGPSDTPPPPATGEAPTAAAPAASTNNSSTPAPAAAPSTSKTTTDKSSDPLF